MHSKCKLITRKLGAVRNVLPLSRIVMLHWKDGLSSQMAADGPTENLPVIKITVRDVHNDTYPHRSYH